MCTLKKKQKKISKLSNGSQPTVAAAPLPNNTDDPFGDNDEDDIARIAREMEAKYVRLLKLVKFMNIFLNLILIFKGAGSSYSKTVEIDRGHGYDDNDSFIDNTEAVNNL